MGKRSKIQNKDPLELKNMAKTLESFGLKKHQSDAKKSSGPVEASSVRQHGDTKMAAVLAAALAASERVVWATAINFFASVTLCVASSPIALMTFLKASTA